MHTTAPSHEAKKGTNFRAGFWRLADPKITLASMSSIFLGTCLAAVDAVIHWGWLAVTVLAFFAIEVAKNASGDIYDFDSGTDLAVAPQDRTNFSGGKRVLVDKLLSRTETWHVAWAFYAIGIACGIAIVAFREPDVVWVGLAGLVLAWFYHGPPARLSYRGLGELDVLICYGPLICLSAYMIQAGKFQPYVIWLSLPLGILIAAFLWINEFPDYEADKGVGKRNLVVRLGRYRASRVLAGIHMSAYIVLFALPLAGLPYSVWLGSIATLPSAMVVVAAWQNPDTCYRNRPVQPLSLLAFVLLSLGSGLGLLLSQ